MPKKITSTIWVLLLIAGTISTVYGLGSYTTSFNSRYGTAGTALGSCTVCHPGGNTSQLNSYGTAFANSGHNYATIENLDSDGDGYTNLQEITARMFPGDAASHPTTADVTAPVVSAFTVPANSVTLSVTITTFTATDTVGVTGYLVTETSATPAASAAGWGAARPASYTFGSAGSKTLYAWAKDAAGNVSAPVSRAITVTLPDTTAPVVSGFVIPASSSTLTVTITTLTATDGGGVTGYLVTETSATPSASAAGWTSSRPATYTSSSAGSKTLYAWAKDAAGNVSAPLSRTITITLPDTTAPAVTGFTIPSSSGSLAVAITAFTATDGSGVTGYMVTETSTTPASSAAGWYASAPTGYTFSSAGAKTLYAWAKDAAGNVSAPLSRTITITLPDATAPVVTGFAIPSSSNSATVPVTAFAATDNVAVTGYLLTETSTIPAATATGWSATVPSSYTFSASGAKALYAWAKDAAGNISVPLSALTTITLTDATAPVVTGFVIASSSNSLTVPITTFTATDNVGVAGYLLTESSTRPSASDAGWSASKPAGYTFSSASSHTLYAWAKDAAGNISASVSSTTAISMPDITPPAVTGFIIPLNTSSLTIPITSLTAGDNVRVTGYLVTETSAKPSASDAGWSATAPASYTFSSAGSKTLYAWAMDEAGNISAAYSATVAISASDASVPAITSFIVPSTSTSRTVAIKAFTATDDAGVTGYLVSERSSRPRMSSSRWRSTPPTSYTFSSSGTRTLYAWVKDAAGNLSKSSKAVVTINYRGRPYPAEPRDDDEHDDD